MRARRLLMTAMATALVAGTTPATAGSEVVVPTPLDEVCLAPAPDAEPGTAAWAERDALNMLCAEQRVLDTAPNAVLVDQTPGALRDRIREPEPHDGIRFRYAALTVPNRDGTPLEVDVYRPCSPSACADVPDGLHDAEGPYPAVVVVHGGAANKDLHRWATQSLAEAGYLTVALNTAESRGTHGPDTQDVVEWLLGEDFPFAEELRHDRVGIAGHSQGASTASLLGQLDPRLKAIVAWDNLTAVDADLWADDIGVAPPADLEVTTPALGIGADYYFAPRPYLEPPEPASSNGEGGRGRGFREHPKDLGYQELRAAGVDTALFNLRAGTHLDFTPSTTTPASRYGEAVSLYLTKAWFDRYLAGLDDEALAWDAHRRLAEATTFDGSADLHAIGSGRFDLEARENRPILIEGLSMCDRMSFYFASRLALSAPDGETEAATEDWHAACVLSASRQSLQAR
jgi:acetyl esterase/lipase